MILCVTGPMAAGKNMAAALLEKKGFLSIDADAAGHKAVELCKERILQEFSPLAAEKKIPLLAEDGTVIRRNVGALIFGNSALVEKQERIVFPYIDSIIEQFIESHKGRNIVINAAVLFKTASMKKADAVLYIDSPCIVRFFRARKRDGMKACHILRRFKSQRMLFKQYKDTGIPVKKILNITGAGVLQKKIEKALCLLRPLDSKK